MTSAPVRLPFFAFLVLASCEYQTPASLSVPMGGSSSFRPLAQDSRHARPVARFPARVAVARIAPSGDGFHLEDSTIGEKKEHLEKVAALPGVAGLVALNRIALKTRVDSYRELDHEALKLGADIVAVYRFDTSQDSQDAFLPLSVLSLGLAPTHTHRTESVVTLIVRDARSGYTYGILEERADSGGLTVGADAHHAMLRGKRHSRARAMDQLVEKLPAFWNGVLAKGRQS